MDDFYASSTLAATPDPSCSLDGIEADPDAQDLVQQIRSHMQSMQANTLSMRPVTAVLQNAQATLDVFSAQLPSEN